MVVVNLNAILLVAGSVALRRLKLEQRPSSVRVGPFLEGTNIQRETYLLNFIVIRSVVLEIS